MARKSADARIEILPGISKGRVNQYRAMRGVWRYFGFGTREAFDAAHISDEQVAEYIRDKSSTKDFIENKGADVPRPAPKRQSPKELKELQREWDERTDAYKRHFETPTPNDEAALRRLAAMDMRVDRVQQQRLVLMDMTDVDSVRTVKLLTEEEVNLSNEIRQLQKSLGIDRVQRRADDEAQDPLHIFREGVQDADWLMQNEIQELEHRCSDGRVLPIMMLWHYFPTHPPRPVGAKGEYVEGEVLFYQECPSCGERVAFRYKRRGIPLTGKDFETPDLTLLASMVSEQTGER